MNKISIILFLFISVSGLVFSQDVPPPIEWGNIPREDLEMKSFPGDTNATAVVLCDYGESNFNDDLSVTFSRILRVKILNQKGYDWGTHKIHIYTDDDAERVYDIEGITYMLKPDGQIEETELDDDDIFEEEVINNRVVYKFTMPNLQPGCIIEIRYKITSKYFSYLKDWQFQYNEPVRWSEYRVVTPQAIAYAFVSSGYEPWELSEREEVSRVFGGEAAYLLGSTIPKCWWYRWAIKDIPALREELYITTLDDYRSELQVQLAGYALAGVGKKMVLNTWESVVERLLESNEFFGVIDVTSDVKKIAQNVTAGLSSDEDKMKALYNWVTNSIVLDNKAEFFTNKDVDDIIELKKGGSTEITLLLLSLLQSVGIQGSPVILSTRDHGSIQNLYPIVGQFNYVIAKIIIGTKSYLLDATDPLRPYDLLSDNVLNTTGLVIKEGPVEWVPVRTDKKNNTSSLAVIKINNDGVLTGSLEDSYSEFSSLKHRHKLNDKKDLEIAKELFDTESLGLNIDSVVVTGKDSIRSPLRIKSWINSENYAQKNGDMIYINPNIIHRDTENPFKSSIRRFPVDYAYKRGYTTVINLTIPDGYQVIEKINNKSFFLENAVSFVRQVMVDSNNIQIISKLEIKEPVVNPKYYDKLKSFYGQMIASQSEQLVLGPVKNEQINIPVKSEINNQGK